MVGVQVHRRWFVLVGLGVVVGRVAAFAALAASGSAAVAVNGRIAWEELRQRRRKMVDLRREPGRLESSAADTSRRLSSVSCSASEDVAGSGRAGCACGHVGQLLAAWPAPRCPRGGFYDARQTGCVPSGPGGAWRRSHRACPLVGCRGAGNDAELWCDYLHILSPGELAIADATGHTLGGYLGGRTTIVSVSSLKHP